jgi:trimeric autotransporter adhesin
MRILGIDATPRGVRSGLATIGVLLVGFGAVAWAAPRAGSVIGNQATASFVDGTGVTRTTTSNLVETLVAQVAGVDIEANQTKTSAPGATAYFPHTITNTGNGDDRYNLSTTNNAGSFDFSTILIYADANADGIPDNFTPVTVTPNLAPGQTYNIVVAVVVPGTATAGQSDNFTITSTSQFTGTVTDANTDIVNITNNAVIAITKAEDLTSGPPGTTPVTITLTYTNTGNSVATSVAITDALPAGMHYIANSGRWSVTTPTALTDASDGNESGINYVSVGNTITATVASVGPGVSGFVRFQAGVDANAAAGLLPNTATFSYLDGGGNTVNNNTNTVNFQVTPNVAVVLRDNGSTTDNDGANNDIVQQGPATQGAVLRFDNRLTNAGNATDTFNVIYANVSFPAGTSFQLLQADGVTPLTDTNRDGIPDTGPLAAGATTSVFLRVVLPSGATGVGPYDVTKTATSTTNPAVSDSTTDRLTAITNSTVDLTNNSAGPAAPGAGVGPEAAPVTTITVQPGATATFTLFVNNTSSVPDSYNLSASTDSTFAAVSLPTGWTVTFRNAANGVITNTGSIAAGGNLQVTAQVTVPAASAPVAAPGQSLYFRAVSPASGALDVKNDAVVVAQLRDLAVTPNNAGQGFPGGAVQYAHTLTINSNVAETTATLTSSNAQPGWTSVIYYDANGNGQIDATDPVVGNLADIDALVPGTGLAPGSSYPLLVRVFVPSGANPGVSNTTTITVGTLAGEVNVSNNVATDVTTVVTGDVRLQKTQALDLTCDGTPDTAFSTAPLANAIPGACLVYRVVATNDGTSAVTSLVISDATPPLTTYNNCGGLCAATSSGGTVTAPANGSSGTVVNTVGTLAPNAAATLTFTVRINP